MKAARITILSLIAIFALALDAPAAKDGKWVDLFDGKTLDGWAQLNGTATYKVEDGTIVGRTVAGSPNSFLCTKKQYGDFELEFEVKCDTGLNSGVQIRSRQKTAKDAEATKKPAPAKKAAPAKKPGKKTPAKKRPNKNEAAGRVFGPQVEIESSPGQAGFIYGEATGLGWLSEAPRSKDKTENQTSHFKNDAWNSFRVLAKGPRIQTWINGNKVADLTHEVTYKTHPKGFLGLQVHGIGNRTESFKVAWRNIRLRQLK